MRVSVRSVQSGTIHNCLHHFLGRDFVAHQGKILRMIASRINYQLVPRDCALEALGSSDANERLRTALARSSGERCQPPTLSFLVPFDRGLTSARSRRTVLALRLAVVPFLGVIAR